MAAFWRFATALDLRTASSLALVLIVGVSRQKDQIAGVAVFRSHLNAARRHVSSRSGLVFAAMSVALWSTPACAQMFAHRVVVPVPLDDTTRAIGLLPGFSYFADIERGRHSTDDERAWDARLGGTIELWRVSRVTSILIGTADEMVANSLKDGGFNPRGISWQLEIGAAHRFRYGTVHLDFVHYCRHAIDDIDPPGPAYYVPGYVATQRTLSVNGPRLRFISPAMQVGPESAPAVPSPGRVMAMRGMAARSQTIQRLRTRSIPGWTREVRSAQTYVSIRRFGAAAAFTCARWEPRCSSPLPPRGQ